MADTRINKRKKATLVSKFAFIIGISVAFSVFFISAYNIYASQPIVKQYRVDKAKEFDKISNLIHQRFTTNYFEEGRFHVLRQFIDDLVKNNLVLHVGLIDEKKGIYEWSSVKELEGEKVNINTPWLSTKFKEHFNNIPEKNIALRIFKERGKIIEVIFTQEDFLINMVEILKNGNYMLGFTFIIFGCLSAFILARHVTRPIESLVVGVWEFSKGNLKYRTAVKTDDEIGILAKAFNYMAEKLDDLYSSMEKKVKARTKELSSKNDELNNAYEELKSAQSLLVHNEKMRSLGEMVAGVAHELNNPINFIYGNMTHLREYSNNLIDIISKYEEIQKNESSEKYKEVEDLKEDIDYEFLQEDIMELIQSCSDGAERSKQIILNLKDFSRLDQSVIKPIDINESIDSTLNILKNKYKDKVNIIKEYSDMPEFECYAGQMNQVFMNILDNAAQAIEGNGDVTIKTQKTETDLIIEFEDNGAGIEQEAINQIFDPFFTTKPVGAGTGLGLSITYKIIKSHNGTIDVESEVGKGTKFIIKIPLNWQEQINEKAQIKEESEYNNNENESSEENQQQA